MLEFIKSHGFECKETKNYFIIYIPYTSKTGNGIQVCKAEKNIPAIKNVLGY